jgi:release factor glutamine methyltransferase
MSKTISELIHFGQQKLIAEQIDHARLEVLAILGFVLGCDKSHLIAHTERLVSEKEILKFQEFVERRSNHEPLAYIIESKEFCGLDFYVNSAVLIPRPETELLVEKALEILRAKWQGSESYEESLNILDLGTGSACIAVSLASFAMRENMKIKITAIEKSKSAFEIALRNIKKHQCLETVDCFNIDWQKYLTEIDLKFDLVISNPPYVEESYTHKSIVFEPRSAIFASDLGLSDVKELLQKVPLVLKANSLFLCEIGFQQRSLIEEYLKNSDCLFRLKNVHQDLAGLDRVAVFDLFT